MGCRRGPQGIAVLALLLAATQSATASTRPTPEALPAKSVLAFGTNTFPPSEVPSESWPNLTHAEKDAVDVVASLTDLGFHAFDGAPKVGSAFTSTTVFASLDRVVNAVQQDTLTARTIVLYFSSHGFLFGEGDNARLMVATRSTIRPQPGDTTLRSEAVDIEKLVKLYGPPLRRAGARMAIIVDTCSRPEGKTQAAAWKGRPPEETSDTLAAHGRSQTVISHYGPSLVLYAATAPGRLALDRPEDRNSLYTRFLLAAIDAQGDTVSLTEAHRRATLDTVRMSNGLQRPTITVPYAIDGRELDFVLSGVTTTDRGPLLLVSDFIDGLVLRVSSAAPATPKGGPLPAKVVTSQIDQLPGAGRWRLEAIDTNDEVYGSTEASVGSDLVRVSMRDLISAPAWRYQLAFGWQTSFAEQGARLFIPAGLSLSAAILRDLPTDIPLRLGGTATLTTTPPQLATDADGRRTLVAARAGPKLTVALSLHRLLRLVVGASIHIGGIWRRLQVSNETSFVQRWLSITAQPDVRLEVPVSATVDLVAAGQFGPTFLAGSDAWYLDATAWVGVSLHRPLHSLRN